MTDKSELYAALVAAQNEMPELTKDAQVDTGKFSYNYLSLDSLIDQVRPVLAKHGLTVVQAPGVLETGHFTLLTSLVHSSGESVDFNMPLPVPAGVDAKAWGSWITYFRRYGLLSVLFLAPGEDDDGTAAQGSGRPSPSSANQGRTEQSGRGAPAADPTPRPDEENPLAPTALQHAKLNAMLAELEEKDPNPNGSTWLETCKDYVMQTYGKKSRTQLTRVEMTELIDTIQRWGYEKGIPF